ncbi:hypothetical protein HPB50_024953 [Hyalomma asiaticum]|uniref:Uncharacterized protein n=1 Tax=Hyalomma asiaticum TaxID=266040 RepID=A0ACB7TQV7_HYAAI|nr:hypothetical protein HPB50_024953 [Hyalomma asiaticum]
MEQRRGRRPLSSPSACVRVCACNLASAGAWLQRWKRHCTLATSPAAPAVAFVPLLIYSATLRCANFRGPYSRDLSSPADTAPPFPSLPSSEVAMAAERRSWPLRCLARNALLMHSKHSRLLRAG